MKRNKSGYAIARGPYKEMFPNARMHHMVPRERGGPETESNLFPWNELAHAAWHQLFEVMTVREVWNHLDDVYTHLTRVSEDVIVREWCLSDFYHGKTSKKISILTPKKVATLLECWIICFGGLSIESARCFLRYQMLFMMFGRYALPTDEFCERATLAHLFDGIARDEDRLWAFRTCFDTNPEDSQLDVVEKTIHEVQRIQILIPIH